MSERARRIAMAAPCRAASMNRRKVVRSLGIAALTCWPTRQEEVSLSDTDTGIRVAGAWMAIASVLLAGVLVGHGPIHPDMSRQMEVIADGSIRWAIDHWAAAAALSLFAIAGLSCGSVGCEPSGVAGRVEAVRGAWAVAARSVPAQKRLLTVRACGLCGFALRRASGGSHA
jgi:hypothetical protein